MDSRRKILRLFSRLNVGGPAIHVVNLSAGLVPFGYETLLVVGSADASEGSMESLANDANVRLKIVPTFQAAISPWKDAFTLFAFIRLIRKERPEIVHTHTFKAGLLGRLAAWITGVPVIVHTYHGHLLTGYGSTFKSTIFKWVETFLAKITTRIITVSNQVAIDIINAGIAPREKVESIELGFDVEKLRADFEKPATLRQDFQIPKSAFVVGIVGRLVPVKAVDLFLKALCPLLASDQNLYLTIIGDGIERQQLEALADALSAPDRQRVVFTGWRHPVTSDLSDLDLCICSSKNEGTSVSVIEAAMAGIPVISTSVGGMADLLENGRWGRLIEQNEVVLRNAVREHRLAARDDRNEDTSLHFQKRFAVGRLLSDVDQTYQQLIEKTNHVEP